MDKFQVISQIIFDGELMIFMTMTLGLRIGYLLIKSISNFYKGATLLIVSLAAVFSIVTRSVA